ncbi:MAG: hypothetical protein Q8N77_06550 [Nanoarchaeota archaeon]|nr:hypothetical protein [Nanoarchaeota archaeon]
MENLKEKKNPMEDDIEAELVFKVSLITKIKKDQLRKFQEQIEKTLGTSLDLEINRIYYLDEKETGEELDFKENWTQLDSIEETK